MMMSDTLTRSSVSRGGFAPRSLVAAVALLAAVMAASAPQARAHCQMPCAIYTDSMRFDKIAEDTLTIEKAMNEINRLSKEKDVNFNQIVRWVNTKEAHAASLDETFTSYFLTQRVKPSGEDDAAYVHKVALLHKMLVETMKCKQTTDLEHVKALRALAADFKDAYQSTDDKEHMKQHKDGPAEGKGGSAVEGSVKAEDRNKNETPLKDEGAARKDGATNPGAANRVEAKTGESVHKH